MSPLSRTPLIFGIPRDSDSRCFFTQSLPRFETFEIFDFVKVSLSGVRRPLTEIGFEAGNKKKHTLDVFVSFHLRSSCRFCVIPDNANSSKSKMWEFADRGRLRAIIFSIRVHPSHPCSSVCSPGRRVGSVLRFPCSVLHSFPSPSPRTSPHRD